MKHNEKQGYRKFNVINTHFHYLNPQKIEQTVSIYRFLKEYYEYEALGLLSIVDCGHRHNDVTSNARGLYIKARLNEEMPGSCYVYAAPRHYYDERDTEDGYLLQAEAIYEAGFDGFKSLDGKATQRKSLGKPLCDPVFDKMFGYFERMGFPIKMHVADPRKYWGPKEEMTEMAIKRGWWYGDGSYPSFETIHSEVRGIMEKFPKLKFCMAHMGYLTDDPAAWESWLTDYENTSYDLTPGTATFVFFAKEPGLWRGLMEKYADRIFFGTDTYNQLDDSEEDVRRGELKNTSVRHNVVRSGLELDPSISIDLGQLGIGKSLGLPDSALESIYSLGFKALHSGSPREVNAAAALCEVEKARGELLSGELPIAEDEVKLELENLEVIEKYFSK